MSKTEKLNEEQVFKQEVADDELEVVAGGYDGGNSYVDADCPSGTHANNNCTNILYRDIYAGGFPNCAATVEDGSWCSENDACHNHAIWYKGMEDCNKAWR